MEKPDSCVYCPLDRMSRGFSRPEGKAKIGVAFFGESLGNHEYQEGGPFRPNGESGSLLTSIVEKQLRHPVTGAKLERGDFLWDNAWKCKPPDGFKTEGGEFEKEVSNCCSQYNHRSIEKPEVKVVVAFGGIAFRSLTGIEGKKRGIGDVRGYIFNGESRGVPNLVVPSYHPAFIRRGNSKYTGALIHDVKKAIKLANDSQSSSYSYSKPDFCLDGKLEALVSLFYYFKENSAVPISYDIETPWSKEVDEDEKDDAEEEGEIKAKDKYDPTEIRSIQFAKGKSWAITVPWEKPFIKVALAILGLGNPKLSFNGWMFDNPRLEANGAKIKGVNHDLMWAWHHLQPGLDKGLQKVASFFDFPYIWKHLAQESDKEDEYGGSDVIALNYIWEKLPGMMKQRGVWESYLKFKVAYRLILAATEKRGLPVDEEERKKLEGWLTVETKKENKVMQDGVPNEIRRVEPRRKLKDGSVEFGFKKEPKEIKELRRSYNAAKERLIERGISVENIRNFEQWAESRTGLSFRGFERVGGESNKEFDVIEEVGRDREVEVREGRWCRVTPFKASSKQIIEYIKWKGYPVPLTLKEKKETTSKEELQELAERTDDPVLTSIIRYRSMRSMLTNAVPNWKPEEDGCVHTQFKFDPPSLQLNSVGPNIQNASKHPKEWEMIGTKGDERVIIGQKFRQIVKAPKGRCVVEFDKKSFHVTMMGFEARDPLYIKWSKVDMHTLITSYIVGEPIPLEGEPDLAKIKYIKGKYKTVRDSQGKPTVLGNQLGLGKRKLYWKNRSYIDEEGIRRIGIESEKRAGWLQDLIAELFSITHKYKSKIQEKAHYQSFLLNNFGVIRWFHDVLRWEYKTRRYRNGTEAEEAISHPVQSDAFGMLHSEIIDMAENGLLDEYFFVNSIHDSVVMMPEIGKRDKCIEEVSKYMLKPQKELVDSVCAPDGLVVGVDVMASGEGGNWGNGHKDRNPDGIWEVKI